MLTLTKSCSRTSASTASTETPRPTPVEAVSRPLCKLGKTLDSFWRIAHQNRVRGRELQLDIIKLAAAAWSSNHQHQPVSAFHANQLRGPVKRLVAHLSADAHTGRHRRTPTGQSDVFWPQRKNGRPIRKPGCPYQRAAAHRSSTHFAFQQIGVPDKLSDVGSGRPATAYVAQFI